MLKLIADRCDEQMISYLRIDGDCGADERSENKGKINNDNDENHVLITTVLKRKESLYGANNIIFFNETENLELGNTYVNTIKGRLQKKECNIYYLICTKQRTRENEQMLIDEKKHKDVSKKRRQSTAFSKLF